MSILSVRWIAPDSLVHSEPNIREYTRLFQVLTNSTTASNLEVITAFGIPLLYEAYDTRPDGGVEWDLGAQVVSREATRSGGVDNPFLWNVRLTYRSRGWNPAYGRPSDKGDQSGGQGKDPLKEPTRLNFGTTTIRNALFLSRDDPPRAFRTSAGTPYSQYPEEDLELTTLTFTRNERLFKDNFIRFFRGAVNNGTWLGYEKNQVLCNRITADEDFAERKPFFRVTYVFTVGREISPPPSDEEIAVQHLDKKEKWWNWDWCPIDQGPEIVDTTSPTGVRRAMDAAGNHLSSVLLDGLGNQLDPTDPDVVPIRNFYRIRREEAFDLLGLP